MIDGDKSLMIADYIKKDASMNVLFLRKEDMEILNLEKIDSLPEGKSYVPENSLYVLFYLGEEELDARWYDHFIVRTNHNSFEWIRRELMRLYNKKNQTNHRYNVFIGRRDEIEQFQNLLYSERSYRTNAVFVSGRIGVGREAFVRECICMTCDEADYEPYFLSIGSNGNIEMLLIQLNSILDVYSEKVIKEELTRTTQEKTDLAVELLNKLFDNNEYIVVYDGGSCLRNDRKLSEWFRAIVTHPNLKGYMQLYVISTVSINYFRVRDESGIAFFTLYSLTLSERKRLLYKLLSNDHLILNENDVQFFAESLQYSPSQIVQVVEDIKSKGGNYAKTNIKKYQDIGDNRARTLIHKYGKDVNGEANNVLVFLSKIEYASENILKTIFGERYKEAREVMDQFTIDGIIERFGRDNEFVRLDSYIRDFFLRNKIDYAEPFFANHVKDCLDNIIAKNPKITTDYSTFMWAVKRKIEEEIITDDSFLISSIIVNSIIESYYQQDWDQVILLSEKVFERNPNYFSDVFHVIRYWYCLALSRRNKEIEFMDNVDEFEGADYHFLMGFFFRNKKNYNKAEEEYNKTLDINPNHQRAKREIVVCLMAQRKFTIALPIAKENYIRNPENAYLLHSYFRCLVRKKILTPDEKKNLDALMEECKNNKFLPPSYVEGMEFEYRRFAGEPQKIADLLVKALEIEKKYPKSQYIKELVSELRVECGIETQINSMEYEDGLES